MTFGPRGRAVVLALLLVPFAAMAACASNSGSGSKSLTPHERFLGLYRGSAADYEPASTVADLAQWSSAVVVARLREIREGHVRGTSRDDPARTEYLMHVFDVVETVRGTLPATQVYVELLKPGREPAAGFDAAAPKGAEAVLYLVPAVAEANRPIVPAPEPAPAGAQVMAFTTPQGFLIQLDGRVAHPLEWTAPGRPLFPAGDPGQADLRSWLPR